MHCHHSGFPLIAASAIATRAAPFSVMAVGIRSKQRMESKIGKLVAKPTVVDGGCRPPELQWNLDHGGCFNRPPRLPT
jgi:hypothetical protein